MKSDQWVWTGCNSIGQRELHRPFASPRQCEVHLYRATAMKASVTNKAGLLGKVAHFLIFIQLNVPGAKFISRGKPSLSCSRLRRLQENQAGDSRGPSALPVGRNRRQFSEAAKQTTVIIAGKSGSAFYTKLHCHAPPLINDCHIFALRAPLS